MNFDTNKAHFFAGGALALVILTIISLGLIGIFEYFTVPPLRQSLPSSAKKINDEYVEMSQDYGYYLTAEISVEEFQKYCKKNELTAHYAARIYTDESHWLSFDSLTPKTWWNPSPTIDGAYVRQSGRTWVLAKYENGRIFVKAITH